MQGYKAKAIVLCGVLIWAVPARAGQPSKGVVYAKDKAYVELGGGRGLQRLELDPVLRSLEVRLAELKVNLENARSKFGPAHRTVESLRSVIEAVERQTASRREDLLRYLAACQYAGALAVGADDVVAQFWTEVGGLRAPGGKKVKAAYLGVAVSPITGVLRRHLDLPDGVGLLADHVDPDSPASTAGIEQHDVLHKLNDQILINYHQLAVLVRTFKPGEEVKLALIRKGKRETATAKLVEKEMPELPPAPPWRPRGLNELLIHPQFRPHMIPQPLVKPWYRTPGGTVVVPMGGYSITISHTDGGIRIRVKDKDGKVIFDGPAGSGEAGPEAPKDIPGEMPPFQGKAKATYWLSTRPPEGWSYSDGEHTLTVSARKGQRHLLARDASGKVVFEGPVQTPQQRQAVPKDIRRKLEKMEGFFKDKHEVSTRPSIPVPAKPREGSI